MALRTTFASYADGQQPIPAALDAVLGDMGKLGVIPCTASGVDTILLTPITTVYAPAVTAYNNHLLFSFVAAGANTGAVTINVSSVGAKSLYDLGGTAISAAGTIASGQLCLVAYNSALNAGAGGFSLFGVLSAGSVTTSILANDAVTYAKIQNVSATDRLLGRDTASAGDVEELTVGGGIEFTGSAGIQTSAFTGDVTKSAGGTALTIANDAVTYAKMQDVSATDMLLGRSTAGAGNVEEIPCTAAGRALLDDAAASNQRTTLGLGTIATQDANNVTISGGAITGITDLVVADGGTGLSSATAYAVLCGGTTGTGAFQSIASVGTSGQILTSNGAGLLPTFQAAPSGTEATTAEMEAAAASAVYVSPRRVLTSPSAAKVWGQWGATGTLGTVSYGISSVTDSGSGDQTANLSVTFSGADSTSAQLTDRYVAGNPQSVLHTQTVTATTVPCLARRTDDGGSVDTHPWNLVVMGDL